MKESYNDKNLKMSLIDIECRVFVVLNQLNCIGVFLKFRLLYC